ncbi:glycosyltransferase [Stakelama tenebrarum]|nr:glycosyltransferase [Sphingosinithalassobacter tenebrarum]
MTLAQSFRGGGVERAMLRMAGGWAAAGRRVTLVLGSSEGPLAQELPGGVDVIELGSADYRALLDMPALARKYRPDLIFIPGNHYTGVGGWTRLRLGKACPPIVAKVSNSLVRPDMRGIGAWGYRRWLRMHPRFCDRIVTMTQATAEEAVREMRIPRERVAVIPNPPAIALADAAPVPLPKGRYILGVGRLEPQKRWERLIDAFARLDAPDLQLLLLGEGSARATLEAQVARFALGARVHMPGYAADPIPAMRGAALVALTSDFEGVPGAVNEALALGTPVVATESSVSIRELIAPGSGSIVPPGDEAALIAALDRWLAPGAARPAPRAADGIDSIAAYLALFDDVVTQRGA